MTVLLHPFGVMGPGWTELFFPYGESEDMLGTSPGGEGLMWGPEYGSQTTDGDWWFLDAAKLRIAHYSADGTYLDDIPMPADLLVSGQYFQYQMPQALDDGTVVVSGHGQKLIRISAAGVTGVSVAGSIPWVTTDGAFLYGFRPEGNAMVRLDPDDTVIEPVEWFTARNGNRYRVTVDGDEILVELPDAPTPATRTLQMRFSEEPDVIAFAGIEVETGSDGTMFILFYGAPESNEQLGVGGFLTISPEGVVGEMERVTNPFTPSDPGSPAHLGVTPGTSTPWLMVVDVDGVRVYTRTK
jgi:hypothetical protein